MDFVRVDLARDLAFAVSCSIAKVSAIVVSVEATSIVEVVLVSVEATPVVEVRAISVEATPVAEVVTPASVECSSIIVGAPPVSVEATPVVEAAVATSAVEAALPAG